MINEFVTVSELNDYINRLISNDDFLHDFWLKGEISGFKYYRQSGHMYFSLKDEDTCISCVMFKSRVRSLDFVPEEGIEVLLRGNVAVFAKQGKYQVYVEEMQPFGLGGLFLELEKLRRKLDAEGYFAPERKKPIPSAVSRVGVVTSQDGAAVRDILRVIKQRHRGAQVVIVHSAVQGAEAPGEIAEGIRQLNKYRDVEVIIVGRGGGSFEDLMAFNSEEVVKAIFESAIPIISAVGHEVDYCLADMAADLRAATPTQAAQLAVPNYSELEDELAACRQRLQRAMDRCISYRNEILDRVMIKKIWRQPRTMVETREQSLNDLKKSLHKAMADITKDKANHFSLAVTGLDARSPLKVMQRGYSVLQKGRTVLKNVDEVKVGEKLQVLLQDGNVDVEVLGKEGVKRWKI
ncbi:MAG TPA: exodeoxyribonuclease VII large subunit [Syntrophomonadaceae bacterium]|nr:exodeoxyribonuclease VII large subunit [Syntrophomonadaceae bacterium]